MCQTHYIPSGPYIFRSGDHKDQTTEELLLKDPESLICLYKRIKKNSRPESHRNQLEKHLDWLMKKLEEIQSHNLCPYCKKKNIVFLAEVGPSRDSSFLPGVTCCEDEECKERLLRGFPSADLIRISVFSLSNFRGQRKKEFLKILKKKLNLPERLTSEAIFRWLNRKPISASLEGEQWVIDL